MLALLAEEHDACDGCGNPLEISTDPKTQRTWKVHQVTCEACRILEATVQLNQESTTPKRGAKYAVTRTVEGV